MRLALSKNCIDSAIRSYLSKLPEIEKSLLRQTRIRNSYDFLKFVKREPLGVGPYPKVSLFENCNRIFSDLVTLFGIRRLVCDLSDQFPFRKYFVALGTEQGIDIEANLRGKSLAGEAFSVAPSLFQTKKTRVLSKIMSYNADYKIVLFNSDAVANPSRYDLRQLNGIHFIVIDVESCLRRNRTS